MFSDCVVFFCFFFATGRFPSAAQIENSLRLDWGLEDISVMKLTPRTLSKVECSWREAHKPQIVRYLATTLQCTRKTARKDVDALICGLQPVWQKDAADLAYLTLQKLKKGN